MAKAVSDTNSTIEVLPLIFAESLFFAMDSSKSVSKKDQSPRSEAPMTPQPTCLLSCNKELTFKVAFRFKGDDFEAALELPHVKAL